MPGPLDKMPDPPLAEARAMLDAAIEGLPLGASDRRILEWLAGWDAPTIATVASLLSRAATLAGPPSPTPRRAASPTTSAAP